MTLHKQFELLGFAAGSHVGSGEGLASGVGDGLGIGVGPIQGVRVILGQSKGSPLRALHSIESVTWEKQRPFKLSQNTGVGLC